MRLALSDAGTLTLAVNGQQVYELARPPGADGTFSLCHFRDRTGARVRGVVLTGPWPAPPAAGFDRAP